MAGHNPHGRLGQPNPPWNHLQVPSYIPRQPQLAHMSNERPMVRSPLTWHTPHSETALYNYIATHKNPLDINPIMSGFPRTPGSHFGSVDLSITSSTRHIPQLSPKTITPPATMSHTTPPPPPITEFNSGSSKLLSPISVGVIQSTASAKEKLHSPNTSNGDVLHKGASLSPTVPSQPGLFVRDAHQINNDIAMLTRDQIGHPPIVEPVQMAKETIYNSLKGSTMEQILPNHKSAEKISPAPLIGTAPPTMILPTAPIFNNVGQNDSHETNVILYNSAINTENTYPRDSQASTSNDDSLDSTCSKRRRKRKPSKTTRMSSSENDENFQSNNNKRLCAEDKEASDVTGTNYLTQPEKNCLKSDNTKPVCLEPVTERLENQIVEPKEAEANLEPTQKDTSVHNHIFVEDRKCPSIPVADTSSIIVVPPPVSLEPCKSPLVSNGSMKEIVAKSSETSSVTASSDAIDLPNELNKQKSDTDDCETIDKIAAMIASTSSDYNPENDDVETLPQSTDIAENKMHECETDSLKDILTSSQGKLEQKDSSFEEVENKLEEMFAGIEDDRPFLIPSNNDGGVGDKKELIEDQMDKTTIPKKENRTALVKITALKMSPTASSSTDVSLSKKSTATSIKSEKSVKEKKKSIKKGGNKKSTKVNSKNTPKHSKEKLNDKKSKNKEDTGYPLSSDALKYKGPYVQVKSDGTSAVVNTPITEDIAETKAKIKKSFANSNTNDRNKIRGLHVSTLSMKYDADTTDKTWICVFCKMGPHKYGLGDLFGPYIMTTTCEEYLLSKIDPKFDDFKSKRTKADLIQKRMLPISSTTSLGNTSNIKKKRKTSEMLQAGSPAYNHVDLFYGMTKAADDSYEIWLHGDCAVWSSGVHIIGTQIVGLEAAVWGSSRYQCSYCLNYGAMLSCLHRGCKEDAHVPCARNSNWILCEDEFKSKCDKHSSTHSALSTTSWGAASETRTNTSTIS